jgi:hypothetical protein
MPAGKPFWIIRPMTDNRDFAELLVRFERPIKLLTWRWCFDEDIASEAALSLWEHVVDGVIDERELCRRMDVEVRRYARRETTQRSIPDRPRSLARPNDTTAEFDQVIARVDAERACSQLDVPSQAAAWVDHVIDRAARPITAAERMAGLRWGNVERKRAGPACGPG